MVYEIIETIASDNSSKFKLAELEKHKDNNLFKEVVKLAYCPLKQFYIRQIPEYTPTGQKDLAWALQELEKLSSREVTGNKAVEHLAEVLSSLCEKNSSVVERVIGKDLKAGINSSTINKVFGKNFIKETPYMGAISYNQKKVDALFKEHPEVYSEEKMDGRYTNIKVTSDSIFMESRQGKETYFGDTFTHLSEIVRNYFGHDVVLNGELIIDGMDRYTSNGAIASIVSIGNKIMEGKSTTKEQAKFLKEYNISYEKLRNEITAVVWDYIPLEHYENEAYYERSREARLERLSGMFDNEIPNLRLISRRKVANVSEALAHFKEIVDGGGEGTILKGSDGHWKDGKPNWQIKFKVEFDVDLEIIGFNYGTKGTKNENVVSSLTVHTSDGLLITRPGGISEKDMQYITDNKDSLLHTIVTVKCSGLSQDREGNYALLHPVFKCLRDDKTKADTLMQVLEAENMVKSL